MSKIGLRIKKLRLETNMTQGELAKILGVAKTTISMYENGNSTPNDDIKLQLANHFNVSIDYLIGNSDYKNWREEYENKVSEDKLNAIVKSIRKYESGINFINVYGSIPAGIPIEAFENIQGQVEIPASWTGEYIALKVSGDSMYPKIEDGDIVIIQIQPDCESGDICACYVNGYDATLKKVNKNNGHITLQPLNPSYEIKTYTHPGEVTILGKVVEIRREL